VQEAKQTIIKEHNRTGRTYSLAFFGGGAAVRLIASLRFETL